MKLKNIVKRIASVGVLNSLALILVIQNSNQACMWIFHQPEFPEQAEKFKKHA